MSTNPIIDNIALSTLKRTDSTREITFRGADQISDDIVLSGRELSDPSDPTSPIITSFLRILDIHYSVLIAKLPGQTTQQFVDFMQQHLDPTVFRFDLITKVRMRDYAVSNLDKQWIYFKVVSTSKQQLDWLVKASTPNFQKKNWRGAAPIITVQQDTYLIDTVQNVDGDLVPRKAPLRTYEVSKFYKEYHTQLITTDRSKLAGIDYMMYPHLFYPFRQAKNDIPSTQYKNRINFFDTLVIPANTPYADRAIIGAANFRYNADRVYYVDLASLHNAAVSTLQQSLKYYWSLTFDIENLVWMRPEKAPTEQYNKYLANQSKFSKTSVGMMQTVVKMDTTGANSDYNEIVCCSFVVNDYTGSPVKRMAVVRAPRELSSEETAQWEAAINFDYEEKRQTNDDYVSPGCLFACPDERSLLIKIMEILSDAAYSCVLGYNNWNFDERVLLTRFGMFGLLDNYLERMQSVSGRQAISVSQGFKVSAGQEPLKQCQIVDPLRPSLDVYVLILKADTNAQKHDSAKLDTFLKLYGLGLKGDVSYQDIIDWYEAKDWPNMLKAYWYCQRDSIQTARLEARLKLIINNVQFSQLTQTGFQSCVQRAVGSKICPVIAKYYFDCDVAFADFKSPHLEPAELDGKKLVNVGGEVICEQKGFALSVFAIDSQSQYPAQTEANNICSAAQILPRDMRYILQNWEEFSVQDVKTYKVIDMYSPYKHFTSMQCFEDFLDHTAGDDGLINDLTYEPLPERQRFYRWRIVIKLLDSEAVYEQFCFEKQGMTQKYDYVFYRQGKDAEGRQWSPRARMLTDYRAMRNAIKKQMKETKDPSLKAFLDAKQGAIKICMNSVYGASDTYVYPLFDNIAPSVITWCSRAIIQYCRDNTVSGRVWLSADRWAKFGATIAQHVVTYNDFATRTLVDPEQLLITLVLSADGSAVIEMPEVRLKYQDTDSNYVTMTMLDTSVVLPRYEADRRYIISQIFGYFNQFFCEFINASMNKFPLKFAFESAFYRAWHVGKKCYMGQEIEPMCAELQADGSLKILHPIDELVDLSSFDPDVDDVYKYIEDKHLHIVGQAIVKRNFTLFMKIHCLKFIETLLNRKIQDVGSLDDVVAETLLRVKANWPTYVAKPEIFTLQKKINVKDAQSDLLIQYNANSQIKLGLGCIKSTIVQRPANMLDDQLSTDFKIGNYQALLEQNPTPYMAYYLEALCKNLLSFTHDSAQEAIKNLTKTFLQERGIITYGVKKASYEDIHELLRIWRTTETVTPKAWDQFGMWHDAQNVRWERDAIIRAFKAYLKTKRDPTTKAVIAKDPALVQVVYQILAGLTI